MANTKIYRMSEATVIRFLELYRAEESLWNTNHPEYKFKESRTKAVDRIAKRLNIPGFGPAEVVHKFKNIRSSYCQELKKIHLSIKQRHAEVYKPKVRWFNVIDGFLKPYCQVQINQNEVDGPVEFVEINNEQLVRVTSNFEMDTGTAKESKDHDDFDIENKGDAEGDGAGSTKRIKLETPEYVSVKHDKNAQENFEAFGRFVANQLKELPIDFANDVQTKILRCIAQETVNFYESFASERDD